LGIGDWAQSPIPNPQSPIPNPQTKKTKKNNSSLNLDKLKQNKIIKLNNK
jgi:hypothetical protein